MNFTDYMWIKLIVILVIVGVVSFVFTLITGKSIGEAIEEAQRARQDREGRQ